MRSPRSRGCRAGICIFSTIICSAIAASRAALFDGMRGMGRLFQGAATVDSILRGDLDRARRRGRAAQPLRRLRDADAGQSRAAATSARTSAATTRAVTKRLHDLGIMINGSFVFGMDDDDEDVFRRTVDWAIEHGITTATFHIQTPYPGTRLFARMEAAGPHPDARLGSVRHAARRLSAGAADARGARSGLRLGVPRVLPLVVDRARVAVARLGEASGQALLLCGRLEEVRAAWNVVIRCDSWGT